MLTCCCCISPWAIITELEEAYEAGKVKAIGMAKCQQLNIDTMDSYGVVPEAWGPFNEGKRNFFTDPILTEIGAKYGKARHR